LEEAIELAEVAWLEDIILREKPVSETKLEEWREDLLPVAGERDNVYRGYFHSIDGNE
jgi:hypothetical protein